MKISSLCSCLLPGQNFPTAQHCWLNSTSKRYKSTTFLASWRKWIKRFTFLLLNPITFLQRRSAGMQSRGTACPRVCPMTFFQDFRNFLRQDKRCLRKIATNGRRSLTPSGKVSRKVKLSTSSFYRHSYGLSVLFKRRLRSYYLCRSKETYVKSIPYALQLLLRSLIVTKTEHRAKRNLLIYRALS